MENPFGLLVFACQKSLLEGGIPDKELAISRLTIAKALLNKEYPQDKTLSFLVFLKNINHIERSEYNRKFDQEIKTLPDEVLIWGLSK